MALDRAGTLTLINATPFDWSRIYSHSYQMTAWDYPEHIPSGDIVSVAVDWSILGNRNDAAAEATYSFMTDTGHNAEFQLQASYDGNRQFHVLYENTSTYGNPLGSTGNLQWSRAAPNPFVFAGGKEESFGSTNPPSDWLHQSLPSIGCHPLTRLCIPASHDAGMSSLNGKTAFATPQNTLTHHVDLLGQLRAGYRFFDVRPVISNGEFVTGHYSKIGLGSLPGVDLDLPEGLPDFVASPIEDVAEGTFQGGNGQSLRAVVGQVNEFLRGNWELVVINLSHTFDTDHGYGRLSQEQLEGALEVLMGLEHRFVWKGEGSLVEVPLERIIGEGPAVVVVLDNEQAGEEMRVGERYRERGVYDGRDMFRVFNRYAETDQVGEMVRDQVGKMEREAKGKDGGELFLLSWTLTTPLDIRAKSMEAGARLMGEVWPVVRDKGRKEGVFPNLVMVDGIGREGAAIKGGNVAALCMAINSWVNEDCRDIERRKGR